MRKQQQLAPGGQGPRDQPPRLTVEEDLEVPDRLNGDADLAPLRTGIDEAIEGPFQGCSTGGIVQMTAVDQKSRAQRRPERPEPKVLEEVTLPAQPQQCTATQARSGRSIEHRSNLGIGPKTRTTLVRQRLRETPALNALGER